MTSQPPYRIGTRGSPLALVQAREFRDRLVAAHPQLGASGATEIVIVKTTGDRVQDRSLAEIGGKGLFVKEIDEAMLAGRIDYAVHSAKDLPTRLALGIDLACVLEREDPRDAFVSAKAPNLSALPAGSRVGTSSLRRQSQILERHRGLRVVMFRGNVDTRLGKLADGEAEATILGLAGLKRLGRPQIATQVLEPDEMLPAAGQGTLAITCRAGDAPAKARLEALNHADSALRLAAERALLEALDGSCRTPVAAFAELAGGTLVLRGLLARPDGSKVFRARREGALADAHAIGRDCGEELKAEAGPALLAELI